MELFGKSLALPDFPVRHDITGIGMSDWGGYAKPLAGKLNYKNTYYHREPKLDIAASTIDHALQGTLDFIVCSDVFEHVAPPISTAFENLRKLLKPSGVVIFSVPYGKAGKTVEHFPDLYDYEIVERDGRYVLKNTTKEGVRQTFEHVVFHGGPGAVLEMRQFSESSLLDDL
jgi:SAM-dependent methyltransferase